MAMRFHASGAAYVRVRGPVSAWQLAHMREIAACRSCTARPAEEPDGRVLIRHTVDCQGVVDKTDMPEWQAAVREHAERSMRGVAS